MGQITDTLRATLRDLAQSDARLYRGLQEELADTATVVSEQRPLLDGEALASREELEALSVAALWKLCKEHGIKGLSKGPQQKQVDALLSHPDGPPRRSALPAKAAKSTKGTGALAASGKAGAAAVQHLEQRLDRLEQLVVLIAQQVGVPHEAIERLATPPALPPT